jgi:hypothetical protein
MKSASSTASPPVRLQGSSVPLTTHSSAPPMFLVRYGEAKDVLSPNVNLSGGGGREGGAPRADSLLWVSWRRRRRWCFGEGTNNAQRKLLRTSAVSLWEGVTGKSRDNNNNNTTHATPPVADSLTVELFGFVNGCIIAIPIISAAAGRALLLLTQRAARAPRTRNEQRDRSAGCLFHRPRQPLQTESPTC